MPPEQFPWDRRDFRKHERSGSDPRFGGGGFGGGWPQRWREQQHHPHAPPSFQHHNHQTQQPWYPDFRASRPAPPGHGKQGGLHMYPDEAGHVLLPYGSRYDDRDIAGENFRPFGSRGDAKYLRNNRENRGSFSQKDWRSHSWEPAVSGSGPGRPISDVSNQKAIENMETCHKVNNQKCVENTQTCHKMNDQRALENNRTCHKNNSVSNDSAHPLPDSLSSPSQPPLGEKHEKDVVACGDTLPSSGQNSEKEDGLGSIDWKPLKWSRSGSLVSRGSNFSHSSSSKSVGVDSTETMADVQQKGVAPIQSPAAAHTMPSALDPLDETSSRKKPRLGWGEGLAKYEKKKVDGHEDDVTKDRLVVSVPSTQTMQSPVNIVDKSPRFASLVDCPSPATPASVACSSSPGITGVEEKEPVKGGGANVDHSINNLSFSPGITSEVYHEGSAFNLENLELTSVTNLSLMINELLHSNDPSSVETGYVRNTSMNKLLVCKVDILKALEVTESEIDSLENELKSLKAESNGLHPCPAAYCCPLKPCEEHAATSGCTVVPALLQIASSGNMIDEDTPAALEEENMGVKGDEIDSPGTATSKPVEALSSVEEVCTSKTTECVEGSVNLVLDNSGNLNQTWLENGPSDGNGCPVDIPCTIMSNCQNLDSVGNVHYNHIYDSILAFNKESANRAEEELNMLLPNKKCIFDISKASSFCRVSPFQRDSLIIKEKFLGRKWSLKFEEKVIALKFKVFQHFWKEGRVVSVRKLRGKSHRMFDPSRIGYKKNRSIRSRISYFAGSHRIVPAEELIAYINGLLSVSLIKPCRNSLKMPSFILDKEARMSRFISNNGLVEEPCIAEKERSIINPWMDEEREIFIDKLAAFGKNFCKIASFLEHKTIADCVEFYYKNHKSECFERARKKPDSAKQSKSQATTYLVATGKRSNRAVNAVNLDILGDASIIAAAANDDLGTQQPKFKSRILLGAASSHKISRGSDGLLQRSNSLDLYSDETAAADVLAGICGSLSSEAMSSCITSSFDPPDRCQDWKCSRASSSIKWPLTPDVTQNVDDECSDESCAEIDTTDWTDEEKSVFVQAMTSYGKDFARISQCVRTKTMEQCKIFFSKARKCLGLDQIYAVDGNADSGDVNGGGSDIEDCFVVQNCSVICSDDSDNKIEENHSPGKMKMDHTCDTAESQKLKPDVNLCKEDSRMLSLDSMDAGPVLKNSSVSRSRVNDKPVDFNAGNTEQNGANESELEVRTSNSNSPQVVLGVDCDLADELHEAGNDASAVASDRHVQRGNRHEEILDGRKVECRDVNLVDAAILSAVGKHLLVGNVSHPCVDVHSSVQADSGPSQEDAGLASHPSENFLIMSSQQNGHAGSVESSTLVSVPIEYQRHSVGNALPNVGTHGSDKTYLQTIVLTGDCQQQRSCNLPLEPIESSQILRGYPVPVHAMTDINFDVNCEKLVPQNVPCRDGMLHLDQHRDFSFQKCSSSSHQSEIVKEPPPSQEQNRGDKSRSQSACSSDSDKPSRSGDLKLFGKILVSSQQEPISQHRKTGGQMLNLKLSNDQNVNLPSSKLKFDCNNYLATQNIPVGSFGFWDGNKIQTRFPPLDSTLLLAKYPAAFANHSIRMANLDQQPLCRVSKSNDQPSNGVSVIPRELRSNIGLPEFPMLRNCELQPLTKDVRQPQEVIFSEMQRSGFDMMTGMQQQARVMAGINNVVGRGSVLCGDQCPGTSNPVTAAKLHYVKTQNFNVQAGPEGEWRSKGDVGR